MARLNISVPDPLYERLDRLRDQVNASRVCATALAAEIERIEGHPVPSGGQRERLLDRLVQRLRGTRELWYLRGREDGEAWAAERAGLDELQEIGERWPEQATYDLERHHLPASFELRALVYKWCLQDVWVPHGWDWLRAHLADRLGVPSEQIRLGTQEGRHFMLRQLGYPQEPSNEAVKAFQRDHRLTPNAYLGPAGWATLINLYMEGVRRGEIPPGRAAPPTGIPEIDRASLVAANRDFEQLWMKTAYLRGWHEVVREIWRDAKPRLEMHLGDPDESAAPPTGAEDTTAAPAPPPNGVP
jgi:hypothetical protein